MNYIKARSSRYPGLRRPGLLQAAYVLKTYGSDQVAVGKTWDDLGVFKGLQRATNQWLGKTGLSPLTPVDGQIGSRTLVAVTLGIREARRRGNTLSQQEPVSVSDLATYAGEYATTMASLAGVTVDNNTGCRTTDYREARCTTIPTEAPASSYGDWTQAEAKPPVIPVPGDPSPTKPVVELPASEYSPKTKSAGSMGLVVVGLALAGAAVLFSYGKKKIGRKPKPSAFMGTRSLRGCSSCSARR